LQLQSSVHGNHRLQLELIDLLIDYLDMDGAATWALRCHMPFESLPPQVSSLLLSEVWYVACYFSIVVVFIWHVSYSWHLRIDYNCNAIDKILVCTVLLEIIRYSYSISVTFKLSRLVYEASVLESGWQKLCIEIIRWYEL